MTTMANSEARLRCRWKAQADRDWQQGPVVSGLTAHAVSAGVYNTTYIQCATGCPLSMAANPTINDNHLPGAIYFDTNISYDLPDGMQVFRTAASRKPHDSMKFSGDQNVP